MVAANGFASKGSSRMPFWEGCLKEPGNMDLAPTIDPVSTSQHKPRSTLKNMKIFGIHRSCSLVCIYILKFGVRCINKSLQQKNKVVFKGPVRYCMSSNPVLMVLLLCMLFYDLLHTDI